MKAVLRFIDVKKNEHASLPLFTFLQNEAIAPRDKLLVAPCFAHFIMMFADLNRLILRVEPTNDLLQDSVNRHTYEDDHHWPWFLEDLTKLGFDDNVPVTDALRFLWGPDTVNVRRVGYRLAAWCLDAQPAVKLAAIEAIEASGEVLFRLTTDVARALQTTTGQEYRYFGEYHLNVESGHLMGQHGAPLDLEAITLDADTRARCFAVVEHVFDAFGDVYSEAHAFAERHRDHEFHWATSVPGSDGPPS